jgi:hypothetical protein
LIAKLAFFVPKDVDKESLSQHHTIEIFVGYFNGLEILGNGIVIPFRN